MMRVALDAARKAVASQDIPVGAAIFNYAGELISVGHNERELHNDPTAHAEIVAIRRATEKLGDWHLANHTLVVTLEPCVMCAGAIAQSRLLLTLAPLSRHTHHFGFQAEMQLQFHLMHYPQHSEPPNQ